ncbi:tRNA (guanine-N(7)-)-methyltransferase [Trichinella zimbabwensis]|uniref:tRNA (guanine-N(7)-)-methyltransferase n=1 Tax=Trichinella zimbabwensis TaxID=268475 RepID=A0A0V1HX94_9BILA|nr:tRNA (guanine-N(7)-)-methyltransferase [Trichinella zimbabwensis]
MSTDLPSKDEVTSMLPRKKHFRQRAHSNPMADHLFDSPTKPEDVRWFDLFDLSSTETSIANNENYPKVEIVDIGCGYGGLLVALSPLFPNSFILGMEIRVKVSNYVIQRIKALRSLSPGKYTNIACVRTNAMKSLPLYFKKGQLKKMFFLFPDPHFKKSKQKWRIISNTLLAEYAYFLSIKFSSSFKGIIYLATDVKEYMDWARSHFQSFPLFEEIPSERLLNDPIYPLLLNSTEEARKVDRSGGEKFFAAFERIQDPYIKDEN